MSEMTEKRTSKSRAGKNHRHLSEPFTWLFSVGCWKQALHNGLHGASSAWPRLRRSGNLRCPNPMGRLLQTKLGWRVSHHRNQMRMIPLDLAENVQDRRISPYLQPSPLMILVLSDSMPRCWTWSAIL